MFQVLFILWKQWMVGFSALVKVVVVGKKIMNQPKHSEGGWPSKGEYPMNYILVMSPSPIMYDMYYIYIYTYYIYIHIKYIYIYTYYIYIYTYYIHILICIYPNVKHIPQQQEISKSPNPRTKSRKNTLKSPSFWWFFGRIRQVDLSQAMQNRAACKTAVEEPNGRSWPESLRNGKNGEIP